MHSLRNWNESFSFGVFKTGDPSDSCEDSSESRRKCGDGETLNDSRPKLVSSSGRLLHLLSMDFAHRAADAAARVQLEAVESDEAAAGAATELGTAAESRDGRRHRWRNLKWFKKSSFLHSAGCLWLALSSFCARRPTLVKALGGATSDSRRPWVWDPLDLPLTCRTVGVRIDDELRRLMLMARKVVSRGFRHLSERRESWPIVSGGLFKIMTLVRNHVIVSLFSSMKERRMCEQLRMKGTDSAPDTVRLTDIRSIASSSDCLSGLSCCCIYWRMDRWTGRACHGFYIFLDKQPLDRHKVAYRLNPPFLRQIFY